MLVFFAASAGTVTKNFNHLKRFNGIQICNAFRATLVQGDEYKAVVTIDTDYEEYLDVSVVGTVLYVRLKENGLRGNLRLLGRKKLMVTITCPELNQIYLTGALTGPSNVIDNNGRRGIDLKNVTGSSQQWGFIVNNMVSVSSNGTSGLDPAGINVDGTSAYLNIYYNSLRVYAGANDVTKSKAFASTAQTHHLQVMNNIIANFSKAYAYHVASTNNINASDYNAYYAAGEKFASWGGVERADLTELQAAANRDGNSLVDVPYFNSPDDFMNGTIARFRLGRAITSVAGTDRWNSPFKAAQLGFYIQDKWDVTDRFQLTYGIRIDMPMLLDTPLENKEFNAWAQEHGYDMQTNQKISVKPLWSPRLGFRYDVLGNRAVIVRGGVGIFTGRIPFVWLSNSFSNTGVAQFNYDTGSGKGGDKTFIVNQGTIMQNVPSTSQGAPAFAAQTINVFNKDFKFGQQLRADLAVDVTGPLGIKWTVEGIYSKTLNDMIVKKLNIEATGKTWGETNGFNFDDRPMFQTMKNTPNILYLDNVSEGYSYNVSIKAEKSFDFGLDLMASYTYGHSETVNNGSSSVAASNFQYNYTHKDPNAPELETSNFDIPHQVMVSAYQHFNWNKNPGRTFDNKTTIGLIYTGNSGAPFSIYTYGDMNGDGVNNDLMFIPTDAQIDQLLAAGHFTATSKYTSEQQAAN